MARYSCPIEKPSSCWAAATATAELLHRFDQVGGDLTGGVVAVEAETGLREHLAEQPAEEMVQLARPRLAVLLQPQAQRS